MLSKQGQDEATTWYEIETFFVCGEWESTSGETYSTIEEAEKELKDFIEDCEYSVRMGYMDDFNANDWRVSEC